MCTFTVAVNRRRRPGEAEQADYFRVSAWRELGENCAKWLIKGKKVAVVGPVSVSTYQGQDGKTYANMEITAQDVEFLSPAGHTEPEPKVDQQSGMQQVVMGDDELPF